ncbi:MAG: HAD family hydrolase [Lactococcus lactis]|nr:HAD family hydrolase [Lactococcus lactis]
MTKIKHIFSDLDGTLLDDQGKISKKTQEVIENSNLPFSLVSARAPQAMESLINQLNLKSSQVAFNGGLIFAKNEVIKANPMVHASAQELIKTIKKDYPEINLSLYSLSDWYVEKIDKDIKQEMQFTPQVPKLVDLETLITERPRLEIFKILLITPNESKLEEIKKHLEKLNFPDIIIQKTWETYLEITHLEAQKAKAVQFIAQREQLEQSELAAFGDNENDLSMLKAVGLPIVMANASDDLKKIGKVITKSNTEDGVAYGIQKYITDSSL